MEQALEIGFRKLDDGSKLIVVSQELTAYFLRKQGWVLLNKSAPFLLKKVQECENS